MDDPVSKHVPELAGLKVLSWKDGKPEMKDGKPVLVAASRRADDETADEPHRRLRLRPLGR